MTIYLRSFIYIQNRKVSLGKKILYQYFVAFCPAWYSFFAVI